MRNFFKKLLVVVTLLALSTQVALAALNSSIGTQQYIKKVGATTLLPTNALYTFGDVSNRWAALYADLVNTTNLAVGGVVTGDLDFDGNSGLNIDSLFGVGGATTDVLRIGDAAAGSTHAMTSDDDLLVTGKLEVDGAAYFDDSVNLGINKKLKFDDDGNTALYASADNILGLEVNGAADFQIFANVFKALSGSRFETDRIDEATAASGVTVDGVLLKDNAITAQQDALGETKSDGLLLYNATDSTVVTDQYAPQVKFKSSAWSTVSGASTPVYVRNILKPTGSSTGNFDFSWYSSIGALSGGAEREILKLDGAGILYVYGSVSSPSYSSRFATGWDGSSDEPDGASAVGFNWNTQNALSTTGAKLWSLNNDGTEKANIGYDGSAYFAGDISIGGDYNMNFPIDLGEDSGFLTLIDKEVTASSSVEESVYFDIDHEDFMALYAEGDGSGGIQNEEVQVFKELTMQGVGLVADKVTSDPCGSFSEGAIFYNDTSDYYCYCNGAGADLKMDDSTSACF